MNQRWASFCVSSQEAIVVALEFDEDDPSIIYEESWKLNKGDRYLAYGPMFERATDFLRESAITHVVVMGSTPNPRGGTTQAHLHSAELRGAIITAAALSGAQLSVIAKGTVSREFGARKMDDYLKDDSFWDESIPDLRVKGSRPAAILILKARKN